ncbi:hypothetical protein UPYG_G00300090 [Umbra pygmaea]|uniref:Sushi domain-containing protein n=1 Tax=Umbra pygmaea TaxID=75934 RepID=A0ABD0WAY0_UMBPY
MGEAKCLNFVLLLWVLGTVNAEPDRCEKPNLINGYFNSDEETYQEDTTLYYACNKGYKPVAEEWWGITQCNNNKWTPTPQCIEENDCIPPDIPNAKVTNNDKDVDGFYRNGKNIRWECDDIYNMVGSPTSKCENGIWKQLPTCTEKDDLCDEPTQVDNAVITHKYQDKFTEGYTVSYKCEESYTMSGTESIVCINKGWTPGPTCSPPTTEDTSTGEEANKPTARPKQRGSGNGQGAQRPTARPSGPFVSVDRCGEHPNVLDGDVVSTTPTSLMYKCSRYYKLQGSALVKCQSNGAWSDKPVCKKPCTVFPTTFIQLDLTIVQRVAKYQKIIIIGWILNKTFF